MKVDLTMAANLQNISSGGLSKANADAIPFSSSELFHNGFSLLLWHVTMHRGHSEVSFPHFLRQPVHLR